jgi:hypothetical protein
MRGLPLLHPAAAHTERKQETTVPALMRPAIMFAAVLAAAAPATAQQVPADSGWNSTRALDLIDRARARRLLPQQDTTLRNYSARAEGFVYFYLDRRDSDERTLIKVDQVALELSWAPPDRARQRIVGLRDTSRLPNRMYYHLDHLTVVQNGFGDMIVMGDGDEVRDVPHPAAAGSDTIYDFRLTDSLTLRLPSATAPIRVYELQVRPQRRDRAALVGSVFVERSSADIVRMTFTFTPVSYVDRRLDYISVSLDNGLWEGRYWLPHEQTLQIRRQLPELDFAAGAVIQGRMRIADYTFNDSLPDGHFAGRGLIAVPRSQRESFDFERGIYDDLNAEGLTPPADLAAIRRQAAELLGTRRLSGLPRFRLGLGSVSSALRYNRAEGVAVGAGLTYAPGPTWRADLAAGHAFGAERPWVSLALARDAAPRGNLQLRAHFRDVRDVGVAPALPTVVNTISALTLGRDYTDPYHATGGRIVATRRLGSALRGELELGAERHDSAIRSQDSAPFDDGRVFRGVRPVDEGDLQWLRLGVRRPMPDPRASDWSAALSVEVGAFEGEPFGRPVLGLTGRHATADHARDLEVSVRAGYLMGDAPSQRHFVLGGLGTLPGYPFRSFAGRRFVLLDVQASAAVAAPWLRVRGVAAAGMTGGLTYDAAGRALSSWSIQTTDGIRASAGAGVSLLWDLLRVDAVRGLNGGSWRWVLSFHPDLRDIS